MTGSNCHVGLLCSVLDVLCLMWVGSKTAAENAARVSPYTCSCLPRHSDAFSPARLDSSNSCNMLHAAAGSSERLFVCVRCLYLDTLWPAVVPHAAASMPNQLTSKTSVTNQGSSTTLSDQHSPQEQSLTNPDSSTGPSRPWQLTTTHIMLMCTHSSVDTCLQGEVHT